MAKRGREDVGEYDSTPLVDQELHSLESQITIGVAQLTKALEQARRFERQKLGRRQHVKTAGDAEGRNVNVQIATLKALDVGTIAKQRLYRDLVKTKSIARTGRLPTYVTLPKPAANDKSTLDLMARLFKQRSVTEAIDSAMNAIRKTLNLSTPSTSNGTTPNKKPKTSHVSPALSLSDAAGNDPEEEQWNGFSESQGSEDEDEEQESVSYDSDALEAFDSRLASSSDDESSHLPSPEPEPSRSRSKPTLKSKPTSSAFLPSLSMSGYLSGSESDATDVEEHIAPRKNRRGQRARQAIWEKKFKESAKHLKTPKPSSDKRNEGWDAQRGAVSKDDHKNKRFGNDRRPASAKNGPTGGNIAPMGNRSNDRTSTTKRDDTGPLHPSWQAKKMAKEKNTGMGDFKGKKITFD